MSSSPAKTQKKATFDRRRLTAQVFKWDFAAALHWGLLPSVIAVESLGKRFGDRWIFRGISFELGRGDRLIVLGKNGAGKSTLLKTILGLAEPTEGTARLPEGDPRNSVGYSSMDMTVYPFLTPREHLDMAGQLRGCAPRTDELLGRVGLAEATDRLSGQLSTGMRARLKLALAMQAEPSLLVLDEPGAGLDEQGRRVLDLIVEEQARRGCAIVATNDPGERRLGNLELDLG